MVGLLDAMAADRAVALPRAAADADVRGDRDVLGLSETQKTLVAQAHQARQLKLESSLAGEANRWSPEESIDRDEVARAAAGGGGRADMLLLSRLDRLDERERTILSLRYGLEGASPLTLKEIGRRLGVTREWVRKIELRAVRKLDHDDESDVAASPLPKARPRRSVSRSAGAISGHSPAPAGAQLRPRARSHSLPAAITRTGQPSQAVFASP